MRPHDQTRDERRQIYLGTRLDNRVITMPMGQVYFVPDRKLMTPEQGDRALRDYRSWHHPYVGVKEDDKEQKTQR